MSRTYEKPQIPARQVRAVQVKNTLEPETDVIVLFRGGPPIVDMYDQKDYIVPPKPEGVDLADWRTLIHAAEHFEMPYMVAQHLQGRSIVPGTRNPYDYRKAVSQLAILSVDPADRCVPFTEAQMAKFYGEAWRDGLAEGLDRSQMQGAERNAVVVPVKEVVEAAAAEGRDIDGQVEDAGDNQVLSPADAGDELANVARSEAAAASAGVRASRSRRGAVQFDEDRNRQS